MKHEVTAIAVLGAIALVTGPAYATYSDAYLENHVLELINDHRDYYDLDPVTLGDNPSAQIHAEDMAKDCYLSHWNRHGLKPTDRYTATGGDQYPSENIAGYSLGPGVRCPQWFTQPSDILEQLENQMYNLTTSPGHNHTLTDPHQCKVNIGVAWNDGKTWLVQLFEYCYVKWSRGPTSGTMGGQLVGLDTNRTGIQLAVSYSDIPKRLSTLALSKSTCYTNGVLVGMFDHVKHPDVTLNNTSCPSPPSFTTPRVVETTVKSEVLKQYSFFDPKPSLRQKQSNDDFQFYYDMRHLYDIHGKGVYTVTLLVNDHTYGWVPAAQQSYCRLCR